MVQTQQLAIVVGSDKTSYTVQSIDIPKHDAHEVLVKVHAAAQNPTDWKTLAYGFADKGFVPGCDYAGVIQEVGASVKKVKKGDRVAGWINGASAPGHGSYAQFIRVDSENLFRIPEGMSFDEAATYGVAFQTASMGLYQMLKLPEPFGIPDKEATPILIWGGASSVGMAAIQLAKLSGLTVIATASPRNHEYLTSLGADYVFSYSDPNTPTEIKKLTNDKLYLAYDTISEKGTTQLVINSFGTEIPLGKKKEIVNVLPVQDAELDDKAKSVTRHNLMSYSLLGKEVTAYGMLVPFNSTDYAFSIHSYEMIERSLQEKKIQPPQKLKVFGGLEKVPDGFAYMQEGKNSAEKIIYHPLETRVTV